MRKPVPSVLEVWLHTLVHFIGVLVIYWLVVVPPVWLSVVAIIVEKLQMTLLGHCFLTNIAHQRGVMVGMTYWEFIAYKCKIKHHKRAGRLIDTFIKITIIFILVFRILLWLRRTYFYPLS